MSDGGYSLAPPRGAGGPSPLAGLGRTILAIVMRFPVWTIIGVLALGGFLFRDFLSGGVHDLKVGDCFDVPKTATTVSDVQHHPCTGAHDAEMIYLGTFSATSATYPGDQAFTDFVAANCPPAFESYVGHGF